VFDEASVRVGNDVVAESIGPLDCELAEWRQAHEALTRIARRRAALDAEEARWLVIARRERVHGQFGYATFLEYVERILGYAPRTAIERLRIAEALEDLPETRALFAEGGISYSAVREITRLAKPHTERAWLDAAEGRTVRECEAMVRGRKPGDLPTDPADPVLELRRWSVELAPDVYAGVLEVRRRIEEELGGSLDDNAFVSALCERALRGGEGSEEVPSRPAYQVALTVCERCDRATQDASGQVVDVAPTVVARARCDAEYIGRLDAATPVRLTSEIPPATRRLVWRRDHGRCAVPGCRAVKHLEIHHIVPREAGGDHSLSNLILLCDAHHRGHHDGLLAIHGTAPDGLRFEHRDGRRYGTDFFAQAKSALRNSGYSAADADVAVERARAHVGAGVSLEDVVRACFRECPRRSA
jgi:5-methylcytosine-specific restriction endonuclease McrA